jgi:pantetheine-phosphate adenylyltransferase
MKAVYPGSFYPLHAGHIDILRRATKMFDSVTLLLAINPNKKYNVQTKYLKEIYEWLFDEIGLNVEVDILPDGSFVADYCKENEISHIVKGLRNGEDLDSEMTQEWFTKGLNENVETVYLTTNDKLRNISSSSIRALLSMGRNRFIEYMTKINNAEGLSDRIMKRYFDWIYTNFN